MDAAKKGRNGMKLRAAHIKHFNSVRDSNEFKIDEKVTCLVGKNESGKTASLQALAKLNPLTADEGHRVNAQAESRSTSRRRPHLSPQRRPSPWSRLWPPRVLDRTRHRSRCR